MINNINKKNLVGYWTLNQSDLYSGTTVFQDMSGNGNNGTSANTPVYTSDQAGTPNQAMDFDGSSNYVTIAGNSDLRPENITISLWINVDDITDPHCIIMNEDTYATKTGYTVFVQSNFIRLDLGDGVDYQRTSQNIAGYDNEWLYIVFTYDGTTQKIYINGVIQADTETWSGGIQYNADQNVDIGATNTHRIYKYDGSLSDVAIYSSALTEDEVRQEYLAGRTTARMKVDARNLITNGDFSGTWTGNLPQGWIQVGATDANSYLVKDDANDRIQIYSDNGDNIGIQQSIVTTGKTYKYKIDVETYTNGPLLIWTDNGASDPEITSTGIHTGTLTANTNRVQLQRKFENNINVVINSFELVDITNAVTPKLQKGLILDMPLNDRYTEAGADITITDIDGDGTDATATATAHGLSVGHIVYISGSTNYNGKHNVKTVADANTFTFDTTSSTTNESGTGKRLDGTTKDRTPYSNDGTVSGATLKHDGLVNTGDGIAYINQDKAYGTWEFDVNKGADGNIIYLPFISDRAGGGIDPLGYLIYINTDEAIWLRRTNAGSATSLFATANSYITINTDYRIKITRSLAGVFTMYIKGGAYGWDDWTTVGTGTDNTYTISNYLVADIESGDTVSNLKIDGKRISLANAVQSTGTWTTTGPAYDFDGTDDLITIGNVGTTAKTLSFWVNLDSTTESILEETDDVGVSVSTGTMSYGSWDNCFIDGVDTDTITTGFHSVILTSTTNVDVSALRLGLVNTTYLDGQISGLKVFNRELSSGEVEYLYSKEKVNY